MYDDIGGTYSRGRRPEPLWNEAIVGQLVGCNTIVNVGAGTGSYEPANMTVIAVEPSERMILQRPPNRVAMVRATAENLPLSDGVADAAMTVLSLHHWTDWRRGLSEMRRVAPRRQVILTFDATVHNRFWLIDEYLPEMATLPSNNPPSPTQIADELSAGHVEFQPLPVPSHCEDAVLPAFWARPHAYLDPAVHGFSSSFSLISETAVARGTSELADDLRSGAWHKRHGDLIEQDHLDCGFRLVVASNA